MIISRREFHTKVDFFNMMTVHEEKEEELPVKELYKEILKDAEFRNHEYMFEPDFHELPLQEETVGIKKKFPEIKTEGERFERIAEELKEDSYHPVLVMRDVDHPDVMYIEDGFHRILSAMRMGWGRIRCRVKYGKFNYVKSVRTSDLRELLPMVEKMFGDHKVSEIIKLLKKAEKSEKAEVKKIFGANIIYGRDDDLVLRTTGRKDADSEEKKD